MKIKGVEMACHAADKILGNYDGALKMYTQKCKDEEMTDTDLLPCRYTKKPITIEAWQFTKEIALDYWDNAVLPPFGVRSISGSYHSGNKTVDDAYFYIDTLEGTMKASLGDWIIRGVKGEIYPCKPDIFEASYDRTPSITRANERDGWEPVINAEKARLIAEHPHLEGAIERLTKCDHDELLKFADWMRNGQLPDTPQPSPQFDMVAVPREVIDLIRSAQGNIERTMTGKTSLLNLSHDQLEQALSMLQPFTKGEDNA